MSAAELPRVARERRGPAQHHAHTRRREAARLAALPSLWRPLLLDRRLRTRRGFRRWLRGLERRGTYQGGAATSARVTRLLTGLCLRRRFRGRTVNAWQTGRLIRHVRNEVA